MAWELKKRYIDKVRKVLCDKNPLWLDKKNQNIYDDDDDDNSEDEDENDDDDNYECEVERGFSLI